MQENGKQVTVKMTARRAYRTEPIWQYDVGHELIFDGFDGLPETFEVHYSQSVLGEAITQIGQDGVCTLPDMYAQTSGTIYAWLYVADEETGLTKFSVEIPVLRRPQVTDQEPTPVEQSAIDQAIAALNDGVTRSETAAEAAESAQAAAEGYAESAGDSAITATDAGRAAAAAQEAAETAARAAGTSATDAEASRQGADQSATAAGVSERAAKASETAAAGSASAAAGSAAAAAGSASQAAGYASTASGNARAAAGSATAADTSARAAAGSAADSQQSAQAAAAIASGAAASAAAADGSATEAAGSASAAAGSASDAAGSASRAAGSAQEAAQTAAGIETAGAAQVAAIEAKGAEVIGSIPADYSELSGDVNSIKSAIDELEPKVDSLEINKADVIISSASGDVASFDDGADGMPIKAMTVSVEPVQDLHGQSNPYPPGGGKNLFNKDTYTYGYYLSQNTGNLNPSTSSSKWDTSDFIPVKENTAYVSSPWSVISNAEWCFYDSNKQFISGVSSKTRTQTTPAGTAYMRVDFPDSALNEFQVEEGSTATAFAPYSNICPISGWDAVKVTRTGKNLLNPHLYKGIAYNPTIGAEVTLTDNAQQLTDNGDGTFSISTTSSGSYFALVYDRNQTKDYYLKIGISSTKNLGVTYGTILNGKIYSKANSTVTTQNLSIHVEPWDIYGNAQGYIVFTPRSSSSATITITEPQVELGSTATAYEPYSGQTYSITLPSEAGTVYGGELTVNEDGTGTLVVDRAKDIKLWSQGSSSSTVTDIQRKAFYPSSDADITDKTIFLCNIAPTVSAFGIVGFYPYVVNQFYVTLPAETDGSTQVELCYPLATTQTYTLSASQVQTILGTNNVWADAGDVSVSYRADTKLYIDGKITEAIAAALNA